MIVFDGTISGNAENFFIQTTRSYYAKLALGAAVLTLPATYMYSRFIFHSYTFFGALVGLFVGIFLVMLIPMSEKDKLKNLPKQIAIRDNFAVVTFGSRTESINLADVKKVSDYDEFYYLELPFMKRSCKFICQKDRLTEGTLEEFESLFEGKIIKKKIELPLC